MSYRVVYPVAMPIDANDFSEAAKKFIKLNHFMNIEQMILTDQYNHMKANVKYYDADRRRKASIQLFPMDTAAVAAFPGVVGFSSTDPKAPYPAFAVGPSMLGGPAGIISPAGPLMVERPAMIGGPVIGGPRIGFPGPIIGGPIIGGPIIGGPGVAGVIYGATPSAPSIPEDIIRIDNENNPMIATTKDGSTYPILKIEKIRDNLYKVSGPSGKTSLIKTVIYDGDRVVFENKKYKPDDDEDGIDLTDLINKTSTPVTAPTAPTMTIGPTAIITPNRQIIQVGPVRPVASNVVAVGTNGRPVTGIPVPFGRGIVATPGVRPSGIIGMSGGPGVVVGGPMMMGTPVRFGRGVY